MIKNYIGAGLLLLATLIIGACKKDKTENTSPPTLTAVTTLTDRATDLQSIGYGEWIIIKGNNLSTTSQVDFNGTLAADSLTYADDNTITVKIPANLTDPINNPIKVTTKYGTATLNFQIKQPGPQIADFNPAAGVVGDEITIDGNYFKGISNVTINGVAATIVSSTQTEVKIKVPTGGTVGTIAITTPVGTVTATKTFGLRHVIYDDGFKNGWTNTSYSTISLDLLSTANTRRGTNAINVTHKGYSAVRFRLASKFATAGYSMVKISMFGGPGTQGKKVKISLSPTAGSYELFLNEGKWTDYQVPFINIGNPTTIEYITFQEFSNFGSQIFIDDVGFY
ncbi:IPT/TIG domain-containing protein [Pedobacter sp. UBA4863]|uniref:IPT/TIG domain-containing protein n=1 Tax=Pedobacter sp. UBA4863 TaxID=1947060 RepID=UPI0025D0EF32|nr:IPT/TIG domain-containing protein [Pedobacter sp. UBA4863]